MRESERLSERPQEGSEDALFLKVLGDVMEPYKRKKNVR